MLQLLLVPVSFQVLVSCFRPWKCCQDLFHQLMQSRWQEWHVGNSQRQIQNSKLWIIYIWHCRGSVKHVHSQPGAGVQEGQKCGLHQHRWGAWHVHLQPPGPAGQPARVQQPSALFVVVSRTFSFRQRSTALQLMCGKVASITLYVLYRCVLIACHHTVTNCIRRSVTRSAGTD